MAAKLDISLTHSSNPLCRVAKFLYDAIYIMHISVMDIL